jgi:hypothetical protein
VKEGPFSIEELSKLSDEELRVMCAELCGWKKETRKRYAGGHNVQGWGWNTHLELGDTKRYFTVSPQNFPNYPADLNAMHEAEGQVPDHLEERWRLNIAVQVDGPSRSSLKFRIARATARQRCIAFIATKQQQSGRPAITATEGGEEPK